MDRNVPFPSKFGHILGIPPVCVEMPVSKVGNLGGPVQNILKDKEEEEKGTRQTRKEQIDEGIEKRPTIHCLQDWMNVMTGDQVKEGKDDEDSSCAFRKVSKAYSPSPWILEFIDKGGKPEETGVMGDIQVVRIDALVIRGRFISFMLEAVKEAIQLAIDRKETVHLKRHADGIHQQGACL